MGHIVNPDREYKLLREKLDRYVTGAPESEALIKILNLLYTPEEAAFARKLPFRPTPLKSISEKLDIPLEELNERVTAMAERGLVLDIERGRRRFVILAPVVIGFFEFTFMRTRENYPMAELARLFHEYMTQDDRFSKSVFAGKTQIGRSLVHEEALPAGDHTEILDYERATEIVKNAGAHSVSLCACRHKAEHLGKACDLPMRNCLSFDTAAKALVKNGLAEPITTDEAMQILQASKEQGLCQTGDNVKRKVSYICNCCGCCCGMIDAIKTFDMHNAIVTSNWIMEVEGENCTGCGLCAKACPVDAIGIEKRSNGKVKKLAVVDEDLCMGCGVCYGACKFDGVTMKAREKRVFTPESMFDRIIMMAVERGKLADLLFDEPEKLSHRALGRTVALIEKMNLFKAAAAVAPLRSVFLNKLTGEARKGSNEVEKEFDG